MTKMGMGGVEFTPTEAPEDVQAVVEPEYAAVDPDDGAEVVDAIPEESAVYADEAGEEVADRSDLFQQRGPIEADVAGDGKRRKLKPIKAPKPPKAAKVPKPPKEKKVKFADPVDEVGLPVNLAIDFYRGITKLADAELHARAFIEKNFDAPNASFYYAQKWRDGIAVEMQEGGGRAYLPELLASIDADESVICALPTCNRAVQVRLDQEIGALQVMTLAMGQSPSEGAATLFPGIKMKAFDRRGSNVFFAGLATLSVSAVALVWSLAGVFIDTNAWALPLLETTEVASLPSSQMPRLSAALSAGDCVAKMEYRGGQWNFVTGWNDGADQCTSTKPAEVDPNAASDEGPPMPGGTVATPPIAGAPADVMAPSAGAPPKL